MQEIVLKSYRKLKNFLGGSIYDLAPPLLNTLCVEWSGYINVTFKILYVLAQGIGGCH